MSNPHRLRLGFPRYRLVAVVASGAMLIPWLAGPRGVVAPEELAAEIFGGSALRGTVIRGFSLPANSTSGRAAFAQSAVKVDPPADAPYLWGDYSIRQPPAAEQMSTPFRLEKSFLYVPTVGYPQSSGNRLALEVLAQDGQRLALIEDRDLDPGPHLQVWEIDIRGWRGRTARLLVEGSGGEGHGWLGVGAPLVSDHSGWRPQTLPAEPVSNYWFYVAASVALAALLFFPGYALACLFPQSGWAQLSVMPVPGMVGLAAWGLIEWLTRTGAEPRMGEFYVGLNLLLAAAVAIFGRPRPSPTPARTRSVIRIYAALVVAVTAYSIIHLPVAQEFFLGTTQQGRMVASPPDSNIPFMTAAYMRAGYRGRLKSDAYFTPDWSLTSRGPLVPGMVLAGLTVFRAHPADPPEAMTGVWPASSDGFYVARILGVLTNGCVLFGIGALLASLGVADDHRHLVAVAWLALAPVTLINVAFLWPKLLATYFLVQAAAAALHGRSPIRIGAWAVLAYLSHPVSGLFLPALAFLSMREHFDRRKSVSAAFAHGAGLAGIVLLYLIPWLALKAALGHRDLLWQEPLGDGRGFLRATSIFTWLAARGANLWYTLVPSAYFFSPQMRNWLDGPVSPFLRWLVQYAKTLPGHLGFSFFWLPYALVLGLFGSGWKESAGGRFARWFLVPAGVTLVLYAGFSADGLGRNCLEPFSVFAITWTAAVLPNPSRWFGWLAVGLWAEAVLISAGGIIGAPDFAFAGVQASDLGVALVFLAASIVPVVLVFSAWPLVKPEGSATKECRG